MSSYYCPYCSPLYQLHENRNGVMTCGHCGDPLVRKPIINITKLFALLALLGFVMPFLLMAIASFDHFRPQKRDTPSDRLAIETYSYLTYK